MLSGCELGESAIPVIGVKRGRARQDALQDRFAVVARELVDRDKRVLAAER
jgi:hypothetical protein